MVRNTYNTLVSVQYTATIVCASILRIKGKQSTLCLSFVYDLAWGGGGGGGGGIVLLIIGLDLSCSNGLYI